MLHVMISYQWDHQPFVKKLYKALVEQKIPVWLDIEGGMHGNINAAMAFGVEKAAVICPLLTTKYQESRNCKKELNYADTCKIPICPLIVVPGYNASGWVGAITAGLTFIDFTDPLKFDDSVTHLIREIKLLWGNVSGIGHPSPVKEWTTDDCIKMLKGLDLDEYIEIFESKGISGAHLGSLNDEKLTDFGIQNFFHRKKLLLEIEYLLNSNMPKEPNVYETEKNKRKISNSAQQQPQQQSGDGHRNQVIKSCPSNISTYVNFRNESSFTCEIFWIDFNGEEVKYYTLQPGGLYRQQTYVEHPWIARDINTKDYLLVNGARVMFPDVEETVGVITGETRSEVVVKEDSSSSSSSSQNDCVLISYEQSSYELVDLISKKLSEKNIPVQISDFSNSNLMDNYNYNAKVICPIMTQKYQDSKFSARELNYADTKNIPIAPIMAQSSFRQTGWLGALTAGLLYVDFTNFHQFDSSIDNLVHEIFNLWGDVMDKGHGAPVFEWATEDLLSFLDGKSMNKYSNTFSQAGINGRTFVSLTKHDFSTLGIDDQSISTLQSLINELVIKANNKEIGKTTKAFTSTKTSTKQTQSTRVVKSSVGGSSTYVNFENKSAFSCKVYWIDFDGNEIYYNDLAPGDRYRQQTYVDHPWVVRTLDSHDYLLVNGARLFFPDEEETMGIITGECREDVFTISSETQTLVNQIRGIPLKDQLVIFDELKNILGMK